MPRFSWSADLLDDLHEDEQGARNVGDRLRVAKTAYYDNRRGCEDGYGVEANVLAIGYLGTVDMRSLESLLGLLCFCLRLRLHCSRSVSVQKSRASSLRLLPGSLALDLRRAVEAARLAVRRRRNVAGETRIDLRAARRRSVDLLGRDRIPGDRRERPGINLLDAVREDTLNCDSQSLVGRSSFDVDDLPTLSDRLARDAVNVHNSSCGRSLPTGALALRCDCRLPVDANSPVPSGLLLLGGKIEDRVEDYNTYYSSFCNVLLACRASKRATGAMRFQTSRRVGTGFHVLFCCLVCCRRFHKIDIVYAGWSTKVQCFWEDTRVHPLPLTQKHT